MPKKQYQTLITISLLSLDAAMIGIAFLLAYWFRARVDFPAEPHHLAPVAAYGWTIVVQLICIQGMLYLNRQYHMVRAVSRMEELYAAFSAVSVGALFSVAFSALLFKNTVFEVDYSRTIIVYAWVLTIALVTLGRWLHRGVRAQLHRRGIGRDRLLVVGTGDVAAVVIQKVHLSPRLGYELVGLVYSEYGSGDVLGVPPVGHSDDLERLVDEYDVDEVIIARPAASRDELLSLIGRCHRGKVSVKVFPDVFEIMAGEVSVDDLGGLPLLTVRDVALRGWRLSLKRSLDLVGSAIGLVFLSPVMLLVAALIKMESKGAAFFVQERVGLDGRPFSMFKFRSMQADAGRRGKWTVKDDPRRTRLGRFIRRFSIDELPQLINVLLGDMSLVGPRPEQPEFVEWFQSRIPRYMERHREKAGITGWAQISGLRGDTSIEERTKYDLWYVEHWSLWMDIRIILRTAFHVVAGRSY